MILSPADIHYTGSPEPDHVIVLTDDGRDYAREVIRSMTDGTVWIDSDVGLPDTAARVRPFNFTERMGTRNAAIYSIFYLLTENRIFPLEALMEAFS